MARTGSRLPHILGFLLLLALGAGTYFFVTQSQEIAHLESELANLDASTTQRIAVLSEELQTTTETLRETEAELADTEDDLRDERNRNEEFEDQIEELSGTVGTLDKLAKTDEELLQKYSKVYFLNEHYRPERLEEIDQEYLYDESDDEYLMREVVPYFEDMMDDAEDDGVELWVVSAFRSFDEQEDLKGQYTVTYGSGANTFSADQGYSEHQLGTTVDFTAPGLGGGLQGFGTTEAYEWLVDNAHEYGFVLSYPEDNEYYVFEPWHWRFVGEELAEELDDRGLHFYDMNQREIDEYLVTLFD